MPRDRGINGQGLSAGGRLGCTGLQKGADNGKDDYFINLHYDISLFKLSGLHYLNFQFLQTL